MLFHISAEIEYIKNPSVTRCSIWCRLLNSFQNFENRSSNFETWILVMLSIIATVIKFSDFNLYSSLNEVSAVQISWFISLMVSEKNEFENCHMKYSLSIYLIY